jgi:hypothetical protein
MSARKNELHRQVKQIISHQVDLLKANHPEVPPLIWVKKECSQATCLMKSILFATPFSLQILALPGRFHNAGS